MEENRNEHKEHRESRWENEQRQVDVHPDGAVPHEPLLSASTPVHGEFRRIVRAEILPFLAESLAGLRNHRAEGIALLAG